MKGSNRLQNVLAEGKRPCMGLWQMLPGANVSRVLASAGVDWVMIDCEHGNLDGTHAVQSVLSNADRFSQTEQCTSLSR